MSFVRACHCVQICVPLVGVSHPAYSRPHPFLISAWSIAGCWDAVRGEPCQSRGTVTFQQPGITLLTLLLWLEFNPSSPWDDLTLFTLLQHAGCSSPPPSSLPLLCFKLLKPPLQTYYSLMGFFFFFWTCCLQYSLSTFIFTCLPNSYAPFFLTVISRLCNICKLLFVFVEKHKNVNEPAIY